MEAVAVLVLALLVISQMASPVSALSLNYYDQTCPKLESAVTEAVKKATMNDNTVPAALLRMHFHDCFIRGCDASVLLASKGTNQAEKDGPPNISLHAFYVIDNAKKAVEALCPGVVSCADILALAARDAVALVKNAGATMDSSATTFDNVYYKLLLQGKSLFTSDQALLSTGKTMNLVSKFASSQKMFEKAFVKSMIKMSSISGGQEIRLDCKVVR
ncbi:PEROXIDASE 25-RELATED [Salix viminalis]|uniref:peroxidase n=1 Tax=Salix viminalis TaxID=40686 RepID=A0A9Q0UJ78_SALVM|nr:PEROXIDASE 25-RELATED [Salix viminalis]